MVYQIKSKTITVTCFTDISGLSTKKAEICSYSLVSYLLVLQWPWDETKFCNRYYTNLAQILLGRVILWDEIWGKQFLIKMEPIEKF